jgi:hypothetical protein
MTNRSNILVLSAVPLVLAACSSMQEKPTYAAAESPAIDSYDANIDQTYVANVEYIAKQRGVEVHWVNPPTKRVASNQ